MKIIKLLTILFVVLIIKSCTPDDGTPRPTRGENSFSAKINGKQFMAEDVEEFANTTYGISAYENNKTWQLTFRNSSKQDIYFYLYEVDEKKDYLIGQSDGDLVYYQEEDDETSKKILTAFQLSIQNWIDYHQQSADTYKQMLLQYLPVKN